VQIELFLDLICPFSGKMWNTVQEALPRLDNRITVVVHQVVQPWHPQGTMVHEAALAVKRVAPEAYATYVSKVCAAYAAGRFTDETTWHMTRAQVYEDSSACSRMTMHSLASTRPQSPRCSPVQRVATPSVETAAMP